MSYDYHYQHMYPKGTEAGGGTSFPTTMRICPGGQSQPQVDPKQQQQPVQSGLPMSFTQATRPTTSIYPRGSSRLNAPRTHMVNQPVANTNMPYSAAMILPQYTPVLLSHSAIANARHQNIGGGQGTGSGATPGNVGPFYATPPPQQVFTMSSHPQPLPSGYHQYPFMFQPMRTNSYPAQNPGQHPGTTAPQPPQHQPQQQFVVDGGVRATGSSSGSGGVSQTGGVIMQPPHISQQSLQSQPRQRRTHAIPIVNPSSGKDITEELYQEKSGEPLASTTPHTISHGDSEPQEVGSGAKVAAEFAAKVAAAAVSPPEVEFQEEQPSLSDSVNGPSSPPPSAITPPAEIQPSPTYISLQSSVISNSTAQINQPPSVPITHAQIPTVSAKTDSPSVDLPSRSKGPTYSPGRKSTPVPSCAPSMLDSKRKDKKIHGLGSTLSPHREEPEEVKKSSFEDSINIKNFKPIPVQVSTQLPQPLPVIVSGEAETNGEPELAIPPTVSPQGPFTTGKLHERQDPQALQFIHERGKTLPKKTPKGGKKAGAVKEQTRRWQEKVGGSDMDAFVSAGAPSSLPASEPKVHSPPPPSASLKDDSEPAPQQNPCQLPEEHLAPNVSESPSLNPISIDNSQDEDIIEAMDDNEEVDEELMLVVKNEENVLVSSAILTDNEGLVNETSVIDKAKTTLKYTYKEGQWSPLNPDGKRVYDRDFLLILRSDHLSTKRPDIEDCDIIKTDSANNNNISANNNNNNNRRPLHGSNSMSMSREIFAPNYLKSSSSQRGSGMMGKRSSQQSRSSRDGRSKGFPSQQYKDALDGELHWAKSGGWKPERCKTPPKINEEETKTLKLYKNVRGILNKLTPQKFDRLMDQILQLPIDTIERLTGVVGLVIDKAVDEPSFSRAYARLCQNLNKLAIRTAEGEAQSAAADITFRKILLTKCQQMFEKKKREGKEGDEGKKSDEERIAELQQQIAEEENREKKKELQLILEEEERKIRVKYVGLARFIGELFKLNMLTSKIMFGCISTLLEKIEEESLECLCKLLTTVGKELEAQAKTQPGQIKELDDCFAKMKKLSQKSANSKVSSRVRFMLQDVMELRGNKWVPRREDNNPKTMEQIQRDAERETMMESALLQTANTPRSKHSDRGDDRRRGGSRSGGGNVTDSDGWISANKFRSFSFEASKLQQLKGMDSEPGSQNLGSYGQFKQWHSGSTGSKLQPTDQRSRGFEYSNKFALLGDEKKNPPVSRKTPSSSLEKERAVQSVREALTADKSTRNFSSNPPSRDSSRVRGSIKPISTSIVSDQEQQSSCPSQHESEDPEVTKKKSWVLFEEWLANHNVQESIESINDAFPETIVFVKNVMEKVIEGKEAQRLAYSELLGALLSVKIVSPLDFAKELGELIEIGEDLMIDLPFVWKYLAEFLSPIIGKGFFTFADLKVACQSTRTPHLSTTLAEIINRLLKDKGPVFIKSQWESSNVSFSDFIPEIEVENFIKKYNFGFIIGKGELEAKEPLTSMTEVEDILYSFLIQDNEKVSDHVCEWVKVNVGMPQGVDFIKALVRAVIKACIKNGKIVPASLNKHSILIRKFIDNNEKRELACLNGIMQLIVNEMESPAGLLLEIFQSLNENNVISYEAFLKWKAITNEPGKGVAITSLSSFYVSLSEQDETDEEST